MSDKMSDKTSDKLLPCPFCGGEAEFYRTPIKTNGGWCDSVVVKCKQCEARTARILHDARKHPNDEEYTEAAAAWNTRVKELIMEQLKKCPFCGGEAYEYRSGLQFSLCEIVCKDCGCRTERMAVADAYAVWNTRKPMERIVERLEELKNYEANGDCPRDGMCDKNLMNAQAVIQIQQSKS